MRKSNFALRLQPSLLQEARKLAESEGGDLGRGKNRSWRRRIYKRNPSCRSIAEIHRSVGGEFMDENGGGPGVRL
jgi:hypothetical protein